MKYILINMTFMNQDYEFYEINLLDKWLILIPVAPELLLTVDC